jgi:hypothetical protein
MQIIGHGKGQGGSKISSSINKISEQSKDSVSKTNKGYFITFYFAQTLIPTTAIFHRLRVLSLLKTVFYKKHPIDEPLKGSYHYFKPNRTLSTNRLWTFSKRGKIWPLYQHL